jgi:hypothetical protein
MMTRKDFKIIAESMAFSSINNEAIQNLMRAFKIINPKFNRATFIIALIEHKVEII